MATGESKRRTFAVIGLGTFGSTVATELAEYGNEVLGIDIDEKPVGAIADRIAHAIIADARDEQALKEAGLGDCDVALVAIGEDLEASIMCTMAAKVLGVPLVWVKAMSRMHHRILSRIGADRVIHPETEIGLHVAQALHTPFVRDYVNLGNRSRIAVIETPENLVGSHVDELELPEAYDLRCLGIVRGTRYFSCESERVALEEGDRILIMGTEDALRRFGDEFAG